jgi:hypothetical protein
MRHHSFGSSRNRHLTQATLWSPVFRNTCSARARRLIPWPRRGPWTATDNGIYVVRQANVDIKTATKMTESTRGCRRRLRRRRPPAIVAQVGATLARVGRLGRVAFLVVILLPLLLHTTTVAAAAAARSEAILSSHHAENTYNAAAATTTTTSTDLQHRPMLFALWFVPVNVFVQATGRRLWGLWCYGVIRLVAVALVLCVAYALGWGHRLLWWLAEREASKLLNGTKVTIGSLSVDVVHGRYAASNVIIHAPRPDVYHWQAPIVARIGQVHVEANVVACVASLWLLWQEIPLELYTVHVQDIQVFVERQCSMYNFLLLDPHVIVNVPSPPSSSSSSSSTTTTTNLASKASKAALEKTVQSSIRETQNAHVTSLDTPLPDASHTTLTRLDAAAAAHTLGSNECTEHKDTTGTLENDSTDDHNDSTDPAAAVVAATTTAQHVVSQVVHAVRQAAQHGHNPTALWDECRHSLATQLKQWQQRQHATTTTQPTATALPSNSSSAPVVALQQGLSVLRHVTAHLSATTHQAQKVWVPQRHSRGAKIVYGRIGRVVLRQARIFVRTNNHTAATASTDANAATPPTSFAALGWNPPIYIERVIVRPHEFCPPRTVPDDHPPKWFTNGEVAAAAGLDQPHEPQPPLEHSPDTRHGIDLDDEDDELEPFSTLHHRQSPMPALYQPLPMCIDVVIQRVLAEVAKSNTGRLFQTALGEMADVLAAASQNAAAATSSSATTTPPSH